MTEHEQEIYDAGYRDGFANCSSGLHRRNENKQQVRRNKEREDALLLAPDYDVPEFDEQEEA